MDIGFVISCSKTLNAKNYHKEKEFIEKLAERFGVGSGSLASVATFSDIAEKKIKLNPFTTLNAFKEAVKKMTCMKGASRIDLGIISS